MAHVWRPTGKDVRKLREQQGKVPPRATKPAGEEEDSEDPYNCNYYYGECEDIGQLSWFDFALREATGRLRAEDRMFKPHDERAERTEWGARVLRRAPVRKVRMLMQRTDYHMDDDDEESLPTAEEIWDAAVEGSAMARWEGFFTR